LLSSGRKASKILVVRCSRGATATTLHLLMSTTIRSSNVEGHEPLRIGMVGNYPISRELICSKLPQDFENLRGVKLCFVEDARIESDVLVVFNELKSSVQASYRDGFLWNWIQEPLTTRRGFHFVTRPSKRYAKVFAHHHQFNLSESSKLVTVPPLNPWWVELTHDQAVSLRTPLKNRQLSAIASRKRMFPVHKLRDDFLSRLEGDRRLDIFGSGRARPLARKVDGLLPYRYSIAVENSTSENYWTEKIVDCFLTWTVPVYFGATNIGDYFPEESFIWLPLDDFEEAQSTVNRILDGNDQWDKRLTALDEARKKCLRDYNIGVRLAGIVEKLRGEIENSHMRTVNLKPDSPVLSRLY
jgi:hypothetical protein